MKRRKTEKGRGRDKTRNSSITSAIAERRMIGETRRATRIPKMKSLMKTTKRKTIFLLMGTGKEMRMTSPTARILTSRCRVQRLGIEFSK